MTQVRAKNRASLVQPMVRGAWNSTNKMGARIEIKGTSGSKLVPSIMGLRMEKTAVRPIRAQRKRFGMVKLRCGVGNEVWIGHNDKNIIMTNMSIWG